jgi:two-component system, OmpR family, sensor histidine kinase KdpD
VHADPAQVEQAMVQILDNAAKYSPDAAPIRVTARADAAVVVLAVHDAGSGLTEEERRRVCERFFRGPRHAATTSGSGLGLWIANAFITANGGELEVESEGADHGTTVSLRLPVSPEPKTAEPIAVEPTSAETISAEASALESITGEPAPLEVRVNE